MSNSATRYFQYLSPVAFVPKRRYFVGLFFIRQFALGRSNCNLSPGDIVEPNILVAI